MTAGKPQTDYWKIFAREAILFHPRAKDRAFV
jgi:hypothetical protein